MHRLLVLYSVSRTADPLIRALHRRGKVVEQTVDSADGQTIGTGRILIGEYFRLLDAAGRPHPRRFSFGAGTSAATPGAFPRPRGDAALFRQNDNVLRFVLKQIAVDLSSTHADAPASCGESRAWRRRLAA